MKTTSHLPLRPAARQTLAGALLAGAIWWPGLSLHAQNPAPIPTQQIQPDVQALLTQEDLKELLAPIALYPDALIALILPASTVPSDVVLGSRFVEAKSDPSQAANQNWDDSVKSLVYYPDVLSWMNENLEWTASVGEAFMDQPADVMNAIQSLRVQAQASGALADTPQQRVVVQEEVIRIIPADPEVIYVPQYDPEVIFVETYRPTYSPILTFSIGFAVGSWLNYDCDWRNRHVSRGNWVGWNRRDRGWNGNDTTIVNTINVVNINNAERWNPGNRSNRQIEQRQRNGGGNARFAAPEAREARARIRTERRNNNGRVPENLQAAVRRDTLPNPGRLQVREAAFNRPANAAAVRDRQNAPADRSAAKAERQELRRQTPTEAPKVDAQTDAAAREARRAERANEPRQNNRNQTEQRKTEASVPVTDTPPQPTPVVPRQMEKRENPPNKNTAERQEPRRQAPNEAPKVDAQADTAAREARRAERANDPRQNKRTEADQRPTTQVAPPPANVPPPPPSTIPQETEKRPDNKAAERQEPRRQTPTVAPNGEAQRKAAEQAQQNNRQQREQRPPQAPPRPAAAPSQAPSVVQPQTEKRQNPRPERQQRQTEQPQQPRPQQQSPQARPQQQPQQPRPQQQPRAERQEKRQEPRPPQKQPEQRQQQARPQPQPQPQQARPQSPQIQQPRAEKRGGGADNPNGKKKKD